MARAGVPIGAAAAMLGHDKAMFLRVYSHLYPGELEAAAERLQALIDTPAESNVQDLFSRDAPRS